MEITARTRRGLEIVDAVEMPIAQKAAQPQPGRDIEAAGPLMDPDMIEVRRHLRDVAERRRGEQRDLGILVMGADRRRRSHRLNEIAERPQLDHKDALDGEDARPLGRAARGSWLRRQRLPWPLAASARDRPSACAPPSGCW